MPKKLHKSSTLFADVLFWWLCKPLQVWPFGHPVTPASGWIKKKLHYTLHLYTLHRLTAWNSAENSKNHVKRWSEEAEPGRPMSGQDLKKREPAKNHTHKASPLELLLPQRYTNFPNDKHKQHKYYRNLTRKQPLTGISWPKRTTTPPERNNTLEGK